jgi:predicted acylesterase/phospholipase RssA
MPERYCDLVMEGGVTSGVVYPRAIVKLSNEFLFHSIGGTSAGAMAAAATAAAEYRRRHGNDRRGFDKLEKLPEEVAPPPGADEKDSTLFRLFSPQPATAPIFAVVASALNRSGATGIAGGLLLGLGRAFWLTGLLGAGLVLALAWFGDPPSNGMGWFLVVVLALLVALIATLGRLCLMLAGPFIRNGFGLCRGYSPGDETRFPRGAKGEPLTLWLSRLINECAGRAPDGPPLTFGMLWDAPGFPPDWLKRVTDDRPRRSIDLQMVTTSLTQGRPFQLPDADADVPLYVSLKDFELYFPPNVVQCIRESSKAPERAYDPKPVGHPGPEDLVELPLRSLPVVVAARLSLSFPFLLSAVPLYSVDYTADREDRAVKRCWFSDGGLTSNFPIHFFDSPLPLWPTFGISLEQKDPVHQPGDIWMPTTNAGGRADPWDDLDASHAGLRGGVETLFRFVGALLGSIRDWQDRLDARSPGVRDRVVRIRLTKEEGGLNLAMSRKQIEAVAKKGAKAGDELLARYCAIGKPALPLAHPMDLDNHRWVRLRVLIGALEKHALGLRAALVTPPPEAASWAELIESAKTVWADQADRCPVSAVQAALVDADLAALLALAKATVEPPGTASTAPRRQPIWSLRPAISSNGSGVGRDGS